tara:strand:- start:2036 stop:2488 length:453 start_codon:yes stop_codon:yes gene_type:complete
MMSNVKIIRYSPKKFGFIFIRIYFLFNNKLDQLKQLFENNTFWAKNREVKDLKIMIQNSDEIMTAWKGNKLIGFGRGTSDKIYRGVIWDIVVDKEEQRSGLGKAIIQDLLRSPSFRMVEKIYLMTSDKVEFYKQSGFSEETLQSLMIRHK